jgi:hypothetical protein
MSHVVINSGSSVTLTFRACHDFEIGDLLKEREYDNGYVVLVVGIDESAHNSYKIMIVKCKETGFGFQDYNVGDILSNTTFGPDIWEKVNV